MKSEFEKMRSEEFYDFSDSEILDSLKHAKEAALRLNSLTTTSPDYREALRELIPSVPGSTMICPPFYCDHGHGIIIGENSFINYNCTILDAAWVRIGNDVKIGPGCHLVTPRHPTDHLARRGTCETSYPITLEDDVWLGANVTILPGVTVGARSIIGAGAVVVKDIPADSVAVGNPARVIKQTK